MAKGSLGGSSGRNVRKGFLPASTAPGALEIGELHIPRGIQAVMADETSIKVRQGPAGLDFIISGQQKRGKYLPYHCEQEKGRTPHP